MGGKLAIVLSGGGAAGAFGVGVVQGLVERLPGLRWHVVAGASTGGIIAPFVALGAADRSRLDTIRELFLSVRRKNIFGSNLSLRWFFDLPTGFYHTRPLGRLIDEYVTEPFMQALDSCATTLIVNAVSLQTGQRVLFTQPSFRDEIGEWFRTHEQPGEDVRVEAVSSRDELRTALLATTAIPITVEPIHYDGELLVDGSVLDVAPLRAAIAAGATHVLTILMSPRRTEEDDEEFSNLIQVGMRTVGLISGEVMRNDVSVARLVSAMTEVSRRIAVAPEDVRRWCDTNLKRLRPRRVIEIETIEPAHPMGQILDFKSERPSHWPEADTGEPIPIMEARYEYGRRTAARCLDERPELRAMLESFA